MAREGKISRRIRMSNPDSPAEARSKPVRSLTSKITANLFSRNLR